jgi:HEPN domain-containing protein
MLNNYKYTEAEQKKILSSITILYDSREQKNQHILSWYDNKKIPYKKHTLDYGDYSFYIPANEELSIHRDIYFDKEISIERKGTLDEIIGNFSTDRDRIEDEFLRHKGNMTLIIENSSYSDMYEGNYKSKYTSKSAIGTLHSFSLRYNVPFIFLDNTHTAKFIYCHFYYYLRNILK